MMQIISRKDAIDKGLNRFFTGKPCPRGHISERTIYGGSCLKCRAEKEKEKRFKKKFEKGKIQFLNPKPYFPTPALPRDLAIQKGLKWYVSGIPCDKGHCCERQVVNSRCRECGNEKNKANFDQWYKKGGRERVIANAQKWSEGNGDKRRLIAREWAREQRKDSKFLDHINKLRREGNRNELHKKRMEEDMSYRIEQKMRTYISLSLKRQSTKKLSKFKKLLGMDVDEFILYIKSKFTNEMTWDNRSLNTWHLDHIRPCESFDLKDKEQQLVCFNYRNHQPLSAKENLTKNASYTSEDEKIWIKHMRSLGFEGELFPLYEE
jgi:hypothetical protein